MHLVISVVVVSAAPLAHLLLRARGFALVCEGPAPDLRGLRRHRKRGRARRLGESAGAHGGQREARDVDVVARGVIGIRRILALQAARKGADRVRGGAVHLHGR